MAAAHRQAVLDFEDEDTRWTSVTAGSCCCGSQAAWKSAHPLRYIFNRFSRIPADFLGEFPQPLICILKNRD